MSGRAEPASFKYGAEFYDDSVSHRRQQTFIAIPHVFHIAAKMGTRRRSRLSSAEQNCLPERHRTTKSFTQCERTVPSFATAVGMRDCRQPPRG